MSIGSYPIIDRALDDMVDDEALQKETADAIARKAGLRSLPGDTTVLASRVRTLVDAWIKPDVRPFLYQWLVDLSGFTKIRFTNQSAANVKVYYSTTFTTDLDPGDFVDFSGLNTRADFEQTGDDLFWTDIPEEIAGPLRLAVGLQEADFAFPASSLDGPFSLAIEAF